MRFFRICSVFSDDFITIQFEVFLILEKEKLSVHV